MACFPECSLPVYPLMSQLGKALFSLFCVYRIMFLSICCFFQTCHSFNRALYIYRYRLHMAPHSLLCNIWPAAALSCAPWLCVLCLMCHVASASLWAVIYSHKFVGGHFLEALSCKRCWWFKK